MKRSAYSYSLFRIMLGVYLSIHFGDLLSHAAEIWSRGGMLADAQLNFTYGVVPNLLSLFDTENGVVIFISILLGLSVLFTLGIGRVWVSLLLWYGWVCLFDRNNLIANPGLPFIGWLLLVNAVIPKGEPLALGSRSKVNWQVPSWLFVGAWILMASAYTISGIDKWMAPSWRDGSAIFHLLENPLARPGMMRTFCLSLPDNIIHIMTWSILALEVFFAPLALFSLTRKWAWVGMIFMHLGILVLVDFADLTVGMLMIHAFTFDDRWLKAHKTGQQKILFFDGVCGLCNSAVDFFLQEDRAGALRYAPLQGDKARELIPGYLKGELTTLIYYRSGAVLTMSTAVIYAASDLGGILKLAKLLLIIPRFVRDPIYMYVSQNRYKWFGKKESCRMPGPEERELLIY